ncbi:MULTISPECIES: phosphoribosyltransferase [Pseudomonas nitroreducens/multiresinivorans group]|uniref:Phosphoribosyltransferase n=1 Tax=Pseudomonas multiresinivorans TaxID=95301 RepID=A0A7Z3GQJ2_9PSED|nr:phosphoribosyltransferase family protein [Pseudomonas multiresinivorans]QJP09210.1 phosphoribosyltransferase [Pseudomonas multiresinivorans]
MPSVQYTNRRHAGVALAMALRDMPLENPLILALPRGGVPVGKEIARALGAPLDVLLVRKIGAPGNEEYALGAIVDGPEPNWVVDEQMLERFDPPPEWFEQQVLEQLRELQRRRLLYRGAKAPAALEDRDVIVVDDGLATGSSVRAALKGLREHHPHRVILAVPVGPAETVEKLRPEVDALVCLETPAPFHAVGDYYRDFHQLSDQEVIDLLAK